MASDPFSSLRLAEPYHRPTPRNPPDGHPILPILQADQVSAERMDIPRYQPITKDRVAWVASRQLL